MNEMPDSTEQKLEALLRQWGADEAGRQANAHLARARPPGRPWGGVVLRWAPAAAAAVLLLAAGAVVLVSHGDREADSEPARARLNVQDADVITEADRLEAKLDDLKAALLRADGQRVIAMKAHQDEVRALLKNAERDKGRLETSLRAVTDTLKKAELTLKAQEKALAAVTAERDRARGDLEASSKVAGRLKGRIDQLARRQAEMKTEYDAAARALAAAKRQNELIRAQFQRLYLAAGAPGQTGLAARQTTVRRMRLIERGAALRRQCGDEGVKALLDRIDVALTRLDILETGNPAAVSRFTAAVGASALAVRIDEALAMDTRQPGLKAWLAETRMILAGADNVG